MMHEALKNFLHGFHYDAHPMAILCASVASLSAFYHDTLDINDPEQRRLAAIRLIAKMPTMAAAAYRYSIGWPIRYPRNNLEYVTRFLHMMFEVPSEPLQLNPVAAKALDLLFILHADHEQNASTSTVRLVGSTGANPYACVAAGIAALWGPAHGGANEAVLKMLERDRRREERRQGRRTREGQGIRLPPDGFRPSRLQELRSARDDHPRDVPQGAGRSQRQRSAARRRDGARGGRAEGFVFRRAQALSERRFLFGHDLQGAEDSDRDVHRDVRDRAHRGLGRALARAARGSGDEDRSAAADLHGCGEARLLGIAKR